MRLLQSEMRDDMKDLQVGQIVMAKDSPHAIGYLERIITTEDKINTTYIVESEGTTYRHSHTKEEMTPIPETGRPKNKPLKVWQKVLIKADYPCFTTKGFIVGDIVEILTTTTKTNTTYIVQLFGTLNHSAYTKDEITPVRNER